MQELHIDSIRNLEDLIIQCVYDNVLVAKLDQAKGRAIIRYVISRDIRNQDLSSLGEKLVSWKNRVNAAVKDLDDVSGQIVALREDAKMRSEAHSIALAATIKQVKETKSSRTEMDVDEPRLHTR